MGNISRVGLLRRLRFFLWSRGTADTALKSEEGADLCAEARFLALASVVRQIEMRGGQVPLAKSSDQPHDPTTYDSHLRT